MFMENKQKAQEDSSHEDEDRFVAHYFIAGGALRRMWHWR
jgi:hypothetical protein